MAKHLVIGVDPGAKGAIAMVHVDDDWKCTVLGYFYNVTTAEELKAAADYQRKLMGWHDETRCYIEHVHAMPKQGVASMFSFGHNAGMWDGLMWSMGVTCSYIEPQAWQKIIAPMAGSTTKERSIRFAQLAFPGIKELEPEGRRKPHDGLADALCIGYYGAGILKRESKGK